MSSLLNETPAMMAFVRTVEAGSFSAAARDMKSTPSAVSKSVARLEKKLRTRLFLRSTRALTLTQDGQAFFDRVAPLLKQLDSSDQAFRDNGVLSGRLRISMPHDMAPLVLPDLFGRFASAYPELKLDIGLADRHVDLIREDYDVALRAGVLRENDLIVRKLADLPTVLVASPDYVEAVGSAATIEDLKSVPFVRYTMDGYQVPLRFQDGPDLETPGRISGDSGAALVHAARAGLGAAWLLRCLVAGELKSGQLVELAPGIGLPSLEFNAVHAFGHSAPVRVTAFCDFMANEARELAKL